MLFVVVVVAAIAALVVVLNLLLLSLSSFVVVEIEKDTYLCLAGVDTARPYVNDIWSIFYYSEYCTCPVLSVERSDVWCSLW